MQTSNSRVSVSFLKLARKYRRTWATVMGDFYEPREGRESWRRANAASDRKPTPQA